MSPKPGEPLSPSQYAKIKQHAAQARSNSSSDDTIAVLEQKALAEEKYGEIERRKAETAGLVERNEDRRENRRLRSRYAMAVYIYLVLYSVFVAALLLLAGFKVCGFELPEQVLSFLVGSTAAAAIGLVYAVTNGLFDGIGKV